MPVLHRGSAVPKERLNSYLLTTEYATMYSKQVAVYLVHKEY